MRFEWIFQFGHTLTSATAPSELDEWEDSCEDSCEFVPAALKYVSRKGQGAGDSVKRFEANVTFRLRTLGTDLAIDQLLCRSTQ